MLKRLALAAMLMVGAAPASALVYKSYTPGGGGGFTSYSEGDFTVNLKFDRPYDMTGLDLQGINYINDLPDDGYYVFFEVPYTQISPTEWTLTTHLLHRRNDNVRDKVGSFTVDLGQGFDGEANFIVTLSGAAMVPEPSTWAMMIGGFGLVGGMVRRRRLDTDAVAA